MRRILIILNIIILSLEGKGQIISGSASLSEGEIKEWYSLNIDSSVLQSAIENSESKEFPLRFAVPVNVNLTPSNSGEIIETSEGKIWRVGISSKNAKSLNLILGPFHIPDNAFFLIASGDKSVINGAYGNENNNPHNTLATTPVSGDRIILEYHYPRGVDINGTIGIKQVNHDYIGITGNNSKDGRFNLSQACNVDINCPDGDGWQVLKNSVCRILINGYELCSGVLVNNTNAENRAFLLTAEHCISNAEDAAASLFVFNYESPWCDGPDGRVIHSVSGSTLRALNADIDFSLVELNVFPPITYKPYLAGWDVTGIAPAATVSIHHPEGDVKKISTDNNTPVTSTYPGLLTDAYWKILQWEKGTTEGGSSGAPLFDQNKRLAGILVGGEAVCGRSVNDYFAKTSRMYDYSSLLWEQLKGWIDPAGSGIKKYDGRDPYQKNYLLRDTLSNIKAGETPVAIIESPPSTGYLTGYNSDSTIMYAEHFSVTGTRHITEVLLNIARENHELITDSARIWLAFGGSMPGTVRASQGIRLSEAKDNFILSIDFGTPRIVTGDFYIGWRLWYKRKASEDTRQLAVYHSPARVLSSENTAWFYEGSTWREFSQHPRTPSNISLDIKVVTVENSVVDNIENQEETPLTIEIYPNPSSGEVYARFNGPGKFNHMSVISLSGTLFLSAGIYAETGSILAIPVSDLAPGYYYVKFSGPTYSETLPLIIVK